jgi:hypothetical protein
MRGDSASYPGGFLSVLVNESPSSASHVPTRSQGARMQPVMMRGDRPCNRADGITSTPSHRKPGSFRDHTAEAAKLLASRIRAPRQPTVGAITSLTSENGGCCDASSVANAPFGRCSYGWRYLPYAFGLASRVPPHGHHAMFARSTRVARNEKSRCIFFVVGQL